MQIDFSGNYIYSVQLLGALHLKWKLAAFAYSCEHDAPEQAGCCRPFRLHVSMTCSPDMSGHVWL